MRTAKDLVPVLFFLYGVWWWNFLPFLRPSRRRQPQIEAMDASPTEEVQPMHQRNKDTLGDETHNYDFDNKDLTSDDEWEYPRGFEYNQAATAPSRHDDHR